jgi:predicted Rossmann fold nucleotide-binding protein DprA/Smf involved in DNA uptake
MALDHADVLRQLDNAGHKLRTIVARTQGRDGAVGGSAEPATLFDQKLSEGQQSIVNVLRDAGEPIGIDVIAARTQLPMPQIMADLTLLQIRGAVGKDRRGFFVKR